jgi:hypothetical protein
LRASGRLTARLAGWWVGANAPPDDGLRDFRGFLLAVVLGELLRIFSSWSEKIWHVGQITGTLSSSQKLNARTEKSVAGFYLLLASTADALAIIQVPDRNRDYLLGPGRQFWIFNHKIEAPGGIIIRAIIDIGGSGAVADAYTIWIVQWVGQEIRALDYYEAIGRVLVRKQLCAGRALSAAWRRERKQTHPQALRGSFARSRF